MEEIAPESSFSTKKNLKKRICKVKSCKSEVRVRDSRRFCEYNAKWCIKSGYAVLGTFHHINHEGQISTKKGFCQKIHIHEIIHMVFSSKEEAIAETKRLLPISRPETIKKRATLNYKCSEHPKCPAWLRVVKKGSNFLVRGCIKHLIWYDSSFSSGLGSKRNILFSSSS